MSWMKNHMSPIMPRSWMGKHIERMELRNHHKFKKSWFWWRRVSYACYWRGKRYE